MTELETKVLIVIGELGGLEPGRPVVPDDVMKQLKIDKAEFGLVEDELERRDFIEECGIDKLTLTKGGVAYLATVHQAAAPLK